MWQKKLVLEAQGIWLAEEVVVTWQRHFEDIGTSGVSSAAHSLPGVTTQQENLVM